MIRRLATWLLFLPAPLLAFWGNSRPFWYDEVHSIYYARLGLSQMVETLKHDVHTPTYFLILKGWIALVGEHEFAVRLLASIFYLLSIFVVYRCARLVHDKQTALLSAILLMASPLAVMHAHLGRLYSLMCLLAALSLWILLEIFHNRSTRRGLYLLFVVVNALGCLIHIWFFFLIAGELICLAALYDRRLLATLLISVATIPFLVLWLRPFLVQMSNRPKGMPWLVSPGIPEIGYTVFFHGAGIWFVAIAGALFRPGWRWTGRFLPSPASTIFALTLSIPFVLSEYRPIYFPRYTVVVLPAFTIWMASFLLRRMSFRTAVISSFLFVLLPTVFLGGIWLRNGGEGCNDKWIATFLVEHSAARDCIVYAGVQRLPIQYYLDKLPNHLEGYSLPRAIDSHVAYLNRFADLSDQPDVSQEASQLEKSLNSPVWVVYGYLNEVNEQVEQAMERRFKPVFTRECDCKKGFDYNYVSFSRVVRYELSQ